LLLLSDAHLSHEWIEFDTPSPIHPPTPRPGGNILEVLKNLATISRAPVQLRSFQVEHAMETPASFSHIVLSHYKRQAFAQVCGSTPRWRRACIT